MLKQHNIHNHEKYSYNVSYFVYSWTILSIHMCSCPALLNYLQRHSCALVFPSPIYDTYTAHSLHNVVSKIGTVYVCIVPCCNYMTWGKCVKQNRTLADSLWRSDATRRHCSGHYRFRWRFVTWRFVTQVITWTNAELFSENIQEQFQWNCNQWQTNLFHGNAYEKNHILIL